MCGLAGVLALAKSKLGDSIDAARQDILQTSISHRGPDASGLYRDEDRGLILLHSRLAIRDLSDCGSQPMTSQNGRFVIAYNGEIYGDSLKEILGEAAWQSFSKGSDTRILLEALATSPIHEVLGKANGMFAFALFDQKEQTLFLARDRFGEKPLYYQKTRKRFLFSSELSGIRDFGDFEPKIDRQAAATFMRHNYIPAPRTILQDVSKLLPGEILAIDSAGQIVSRRYFSASQSFTSRERVRFGVKPEELSEVLSQATSERMVSDVPIGCLLSGGIDSSLIAYFMQAASSQAINTYSIGFERQDLDEAPFARAIASRIGTSHNELYISDSDALSIIPRLSKIYSEPFADSSQIPTLLVSEFARQSVPVVLTGDGGDELFAGYRRYGIGLSQIRFARRSRFLGKLSNSDAAKRALRLVAHSLPNSILETVTGIRNLDSKIDRLLEVNSSRHIEDFYKKMVSHWSEPTKIVQADKEFIPEAWTQVRQLERLSDLDKMRLLDILTYMPDDILTKVDRASMSVGLETRAPFLDPNVLDLSLRYADEQLIGTKGELKKPLRSLAFDLIGRDIMDRPKMGFGVPLGDWLRGPLRPWVQDLLSSKISGELFDESLIREYWNRHERGEDWGYWIWNYLMLKDWLRSNPNVSV